MAIGDMAMTMGDALVGAGVLGGAGTTTGSGVLDVLVLGSLRVAAMLLLLTGIVVVLRSASAATRHAVWRVGFVVALLLPLVAAALPWRLELLPGRPDAVASLGQELMDGPRREALAPPAEPGGNEGRVAGSDKSSSIAPPSEYEASGAAAADEGSPLSLLGGLDLAGVLLMVWLAGALLLAVRLLLGHGAVRRILRGGRRLTGAEWTSPLYEAADILDVAVDVDLVASDRVTMPFTAGIRRPAIVLPESASGWDMDRRRAVLMHELAHVQRRDLVSHHVARWVCALHWFNPLAWAGARRMRADSERAADDLVLNAGTRASDYADHLLQIVSGAGHSPMPAPALPLAQRREFEGRVLAILEPGIRRSGPGRLQSLAVTALILLLTLPLAALDRAGSPSVAESELAFDESDSEGKHGASISEHEHVTSSDSESEADRESSDEFGADVGPDAELPESFMEPAQPVPAKPGFIERMLGMALPGAGAATQATADRVMPALMSTLGDADAEVRQTVVAALGEMDDPRSVQALMRILRDDPVDEVRAAAAWALGEIGDPTAVPALIEALRTDVCEETRKNAAWALGEIEDARAVEALGAALRDSDAEVRETAMWALGEIESPAAVPSLIAALNSDDAEVRQMAAWSLGQIEDARAVEGLVAALRSRDAELRETAAWALGEIESPSAVAALMPLVADPAAPVRSAAVHALAQIEDPAAAPALVRALQDASDEVRSMAAFALGELDLRTAPAGLVQALRDENVEVRTAAAHALAEIGDPATIPALTAALNDTSDEVRMSAIHALIDMDSDAGTGALLELLDHEDPQVRKHAAEALGED